MPPVIQSIGFVSNQLVVAICSGWVRLTPDPQGSHMLCPKPVNVQGCDCGLFAFANTVHTTEQTLNPLFCFRQRGQGANATLFCEQQRCNFHPGLIDHFPGLLQ